MIHRGEVVGMSVRDICHLYYFTWLTRDAARSAIHECVEVFYNRRRRPSYCGNLSGAEFETQFFAAHAA